jgi:tetratricopeptide (TPR) repeat protein
MQCPNCGREMRRLSKFWVCEEHDPPVAIPIRTTPAETVHPYSKLCSQLPTPIAVPIDEFGKWAENKSPMLAYRALWAMVDAAELITRFIAIVALLDVRRQTGETPEPLRKVLVNVLERPTFGAWRDIAHSAIEKLGTSTLVQELPDFWKQHWGPLFEGGSAEQSIIELRNRMAHTARLTDEEAQRLLDAHCERFEKAICALNFWASYRLIAVLSDGRAVRLHGVPDPQGWVLPEESNLPTDLSAYRERVVLLSQDGLGLLVLFPLQLYNPVLVVREGHHEIVDDRPAPMVYMRYNRQHQLLEYTALAPNYAFSQQQLRDAFNELFPISKWRRELEQQQAARTEWEQEGYHFRDLIDNLTEELYGRAAHLEQVKQWLREYRQSGGVLWIGGRPGVGKSALMAKLAKDLQGDSRAVLIPFFFRSGDHRCGADRFYRAACLRLAEQLRISLERKPNQRYADLFSEVMQRVSDALPDDKTVIFLLDGLDEGVRHEPDLPEIPLRYQSPRVVWICAGRREESLRALWDNAATHKLWDDGELPPLSQDNIRAWLQNELGRLRYELFDLDTRDGDQLRNEFIEELTRRSEGLPLFVRMVIEDLKARRYTVRDGKHLPQGLVEYYQLLLERLNVSDVGRVLTEALTLLSWAQEPLALQTIIAILMQAHLASQDELQQLVAQVLEFGHTTLERRITPEGEWGWTLYHDSFREFLRTSERVQVTRREMQHALLAWCAQWQTHKSPYALRHYAEHLREANQVEALCALARDEAFAQAQIEGVPNDPDLPRQTAALALQAAIEREDVPTIAEMLLLHARRVETVESPLDALRAGNPQRALRIAERILREQNYQIGTLWLLLLVWNTVNESHDNIEQSCVSVAARSLRVIKEWWKAHNPTALEGWQGTLATLLLHRLILSIGMNALEDIFLILQDEYKRQLVDHLLASVCELGRAGSGLEEVQSAISQALTIVQAIRLEEQRAKALLAIAERQALADLYAEALQTAQKIGEREAHYQALSAIAERQALAGLYAEALQTARKIEDEEWRYKALVVIAERQAQARMHKAAAKTFAEAIEAAQRIKNEWRCYEALVAIAERQAQARMHKAAAKTFAEAIEAAQRVGYEPFRFEALTKIAECQVLVGMHRASVVTFAAAIRAAQSIEEELKRSESLAAIAACQAQIGQYTEALQTAQKINRKDICSKALAVIAECQARARMCEAAAITFAEAIHTVRTVRNTYWRHRALEAIAACQAQAGLYAEALQTAQKIGDEYNYSNTLAMIAACQAQAGLYAEALQTAQKIGDEWKHSEALAKIAECQAQAGQYAEALQTAQKIGDEYNYSNTLAMIAACQAQAGLYAEAVQTAQKIGNERRRSEALAKIAECQAQAGHYAEAIRTAQIDQDKWWRSNPLAAIAVYQAQVGQHAEALQTAQKIECEKKRSEVLAIIAEHQVQSGMRKAAATTFAEAVQVAYRIENREAHSQALAVIAECRAQVGQYAEALQTAQKIGDERRRSEALAKIAKCQAQLGQYTQALRTVRRIENEWWCSETLAVIAECQAQAGLYAEALQTAQKIKNELSRCKVLAVIGAHQAQSGMRKAAAITFAEAILAAQEIGWLWHSEALAVVAAYQAQARQYAKALQTARKIESELWRTKALAEIAAYQRRSKIKRAAIFAEALQTAQSIECDEVRSEALAVVAAYQARAGQYVEALQTARKIENELRLSCALESIAEYQAQAGLLDLAVRTAKEIPGEDGRNENLWAIAITAAKVGNSTLAQQLLSCLSVAHEEHIFTLTSILAERGEKSTFLAILPLCGWSRTIAFKACFSIATLYPQHHLAVLKLLARELGVGRDGESDSEKIS